MCSVWTAEAIVSSHLVVHAGGEVSCESSQSWMHLERSTFHRCVLTACNGATVTMQNISAQRPRTTGTSHDESVPAAVHEPVSVNILAAGTNVDAKRAEFDGGIRVGAGGKLTATDVDIFVRRSKYHGLEVTGEGSQVDLEDSRVLLAPGDVPRGFQTGVIVQGKAQVAMRKVVTQGLNRGCSISHGATVNMTKCELHGLQLGLYVVGPATRMHARACAFEGEDHPAYVDRASETSFGWRCKGKIKKFAEASTTKGEVPGWGLLRGCVPTRSGQDMP